MLRKIGNGLHNLGSVLHSMSKAQAQWDIEVSRTILTRRKKWLLIALAPVILGLIWSSSSDAPAADNVATPVIALAAAASVAPAPEDVPLPAKIPILGGSKAYMPCQVNTNMFLGSILVGLIAGLITGVIGAGGGYILTPALMSFGVRGIMSVGTDQFHLFAKAIMGTTIHRKLGNVNLALAAWFVGGSVFGVMLGGYLSRAIFLYSPAMSDAMISSVYVLVLGVLGIYALADWLRLRKADPAVHAVEATTSFAKWLQRLPLRPRVAFDGRVVPGGRSICVYPVILCGFLVGFVASIMGVGGGFLTFPMFVYGLGVSTFTTVGTDILQIIFTAGFSSIKEYAIYGFVFYTVAIGMLVGSLFGVQIGAMVTNVVKGSAIRAFFALTILAGFFNRVCALPRKLADLGYLSMARDTSVAIENVGVVLFFATVGTFALWILAVFVLKLRLMRVDPDTSGPIPPGGPLVVSPGRLGLGLAGLAVFAVVLAFGVTGSSDGRTALASADNFFNQLAKDGAYYIPDAKKKVARMADLPIDIGFSPREKVDMAKMCAVIADSGCEITETGEKPSRPRIRGTMGQLCNTALADAELAFRNEDGSFLCDHGLHSHEVAYCWWVVFDALSNRYVKENRGEEAEVTRFIAAKVMEPVYNFRGIEARNIRDNWAPLAGLLGFYILYTLWYGFAILLVMEGFGIRMTVVAGREET